MTKKGQGMSMCAFSLFCVVCVKFGTSWNADDKRFQWLHHYMLDSLLSPLNTSRIAQDLHEFFDCDLKQKCSDLLGLWLPWRASSVVVAGHFSNCPRPVLFFLFTLNKFDSWQFSNLFSTKNCPSNDVYVEELKAPLVVLHSCFLFFYRKHM